MQTMTLSQDAVVVFRLRVKGLRLPVTEPRLLAYRELVAAGIMVPEGEEFQFTDDASARREELLNESQDRIERERFETPDASHLSESAREVLRRRLAGDREVTDANRPAYRELVAARIMMPVHSFLGGPESDFHFTYWGWERRFEFAEMSCATRAC